MSTLYMICKKYPVLVRHGYNLSRRYTSGPHIRCDPAKPRVDEPTRYSVRGLGREESVTFTAELSDDISPTFISYAHYKSDTAGHIDVSKQSSRGGSYTGIEPMGLLWSMKAENGSRIGARLGKSDVTTPHNVKLSILKGHQRIQSTSDIASSKILCCVNHPRMFMSQGVKRIPIREGRIRGTLFLPKGGGPYPGVIAMHGTTGGLNETKAALHASNGFATLALAFSRYQDLGKYLDIDVEYFEESVDWFTSNPHISDTGIGVTGLSYGSSAAMLMAIYSSKVKAVVVINGTHTYAFAKHFKRGKRLPTMWPDLPWGCMKETSDGYIFSEHFWKDGILEDTIIPLEKAEGAHFYFIDGEDDLCGHPDHFNFMIERLKAHGKSNFRLLRYPETGHIIQPPYTPFNRHLYHSLVERLCVSGGEMNSHTRAQEHSWREILKFFKDRLCA